MSRPGRLPFNHGSLPLKGESGNALVYGENDRSDIHGYAIRVRRYLALIAESNLPDEDKKALVEFSEVLRAQGLHIGRVMKYLYHLRVCAENITKLSDSPSLKAADGWFKLEEVCVTYDCSYHTSMPQGVNIDFFNEKEGPSARVAVELSPKSAMELVHAIMESLFSAEIDPGEAALGLASITAPPATTLGMK
jgi:hypothetical protein